MYNDILPIFRHYINHNEMKGSINDSKTNDNILV